MDNKLVQASIITIGDELIIGQVIDTNSAWIAQQLNAEGIWIKRRVSVGDNYNDIRQALDEESSNSTIVLITGGLGPTADDITKPLLCQYFNSHMIVDENVLQHVQHLFEKVFKRPFTELNRKQAEVPAACTVIHNARGTAPGMLFEKDNVTFISIPGVPHEMKGMMTDLILPMIRQKYSGGYILHRTLLTAGIGESALAEHIAGWETKLPAFIKLAYLPSYGMVRLRLTASGSNKNAMVVEIDNRFAELKELTKEWLVVDEDLSLAQVVTRNLKTLQKGMCTAESCTGGYIAHLITSIAGSSEIFNGSIVAYANDVKEKMLGVHSETLSKHGAVSEQTVNEMLLGALDHLNCEYCIATSGIMGPGGGSDTKPVGTVWIAAGSRERMLTQKFNFRFDRARNIEITAVQALNLLRKAMIQPVLLTLVSLTHFLTFVR